MRQVAVLGMTLCVLASGPWLVAAGDKDEATRQTVPAQPANAYAEHLRATKGILDVRTLHLLRSEALTPGHHHLGANLNVQCERVRRDFGFLSRNKAWRVTVLPHTRPRVNVPPEVRVSPDGVVDVPVSVEHVAPSLFLLEVVHAPADASLENGRFKWRPNGRTGSWRVDFNALAPQKLGVTASMAIHVAVPRAEAELIEIEPVDPIDAVTGKLVSLRLTANPQNGGHLLFEPVRFVDGVSLGRYTGALSWTPQPNQGGPQQMSIRVRNRSGMRDVDLLFRVRRAVTPSPIFGRYKQDTRQALAQISRAPCAYRQILEPIRLLRDRYGPVHREALAVLKTAYSDLDPELRANALDELSRYAWAFTAKPEILKWLHEIAALDSSTAAVRLGSRLAEVDRFNANRLESAAADDARREQERIRALVGVVTAWQMSEVYARDGSNANNLLACEFPPEQGTTLEANWTTVKTFPDGTLDVRHALDQAKLPGPRDNCAVYLRAVLEAPDDIDARLELGSDDGTKLWLNDKETFSHPVQRPMTPGEDKQNVRLKRGSNTLLVKISQGGGDWQAYARVRATDGKPLPNLKVGLLSGCGATTEVEESGRRGRKEPH